MQKLNSRLGVVEYSPPSDGDRRAARRFSGHAFLRKPFWVLLWPVPGAAWRHSSPRPSQSSAYLAPKFAQGRHSVAAIATRCRDCGSERRIRGIVLQWLQLNAALEQTSVQ